MPIDWSPFVEIVRTGSRFVLTSHMRPDCDALGSELGMQQLLEGLGKQAVIVNGDVVPPHIAFIDPERRIQTLGRDLQAGELDDYDVLMVIDTSAWNQLGPMAEVVRGFSGKKVVIDHHVSEDDFKAVVFKDPTAEATGRLVLEAASALRVTVTPEMAAPLFAAIATDTGWFRFSSVDAHTFAAAAKLVFAGVRPVEVFSALYEQNSLARIRLRGKILSSVESAHDGHVLYAQATLADFAQTGAEMTDTEDVVNTLLTVAGTRSAVLFVEVESNRTKVSLRSRGDVDVRAVAEQFGGGGHTAAAGVSFAGSLAKARTAILDALEGASR